MATKTGQSFVGKNKLSEGQETQRKDRDGYECCLHKHRMSHRMSVYHITAQCNRVMMQRAQDSSYHQYNEKTTTITHICLEVVAFLDAECY